VLAELVADADLLSGAELLQLLQAVEYIYQGTEVPAVLKRVVAAILINELDNSARLQDVLVLLDERGLLEGELLCIHGPVHNAFLKGNIIRRQQKGRMRLDVDHLLRVAPEQAVAVAAAELRGGASAAAAVLEARAQHAAEVQMRYWQKQRLQVRQKQLIAAEKLRQQQQRVWGFSTLPDPADDEAVKLEELYTAAEAAAADKAAQQQL
jgi:hypothetical protein